MLLRIRIYLFAVLSFVSVSAVAQLNTLQSSDRLNWKELENDFVRVIYPDFMEKKAQYIANLVEHYHAFVGKSYYVNDPKQFELILRAESNMSNGFVTLAPRRSEWYTAQNISPFVGSLEWFQTLAIHEYRHVVQMDFLKQGYDKFLWYLFGDNGRAIGRFLSVDNWFMEGDAVWSETAYSDGGRGRSPRFSARLKSLVLSDLINHELSYDHFLTGDYRWPLPSWYVYGYFVVTRARRIYGEMVWEKVLWDATHSFYNPWRFYNSFKTVTGQKFEDFFDETLIELRKKWLKEGAKVETENKEYHLYASPKKEANNLFALKKTLDTFWELIQIKEGKEIVLTQINTIPSLSKVDIKSDQLVYTQFVPDLRYGHKGFSDIYLYNMKLDEHQAITSDKRYFHPNFSSAGEKIVAVKFNQDDTWQVDILSLTGAVIKEIKLKDYFITEAIFVSEVKLAFFIQDKMGKKALALYDLEEDSLEQMLPFTQANLFAMQAHENKVYFESDYKGKVETLSLDIKSSQLLKCTESSIARYWPSVSENRLYTVNETVNGHELTIEELDCKEISKNILKNFNYLSKDSPSDQYVTQEPVSFDNHKDQYKTNYKSQDYDYFSDMINLHSWSFLGGLGFQLQGTSTNYLNDFSMTASVGENSIEDRAFTGVNLTYSRFYPIFSLDINYAQRNEKFEDKPNDEYSEATGLFSVSLPLNFSKNFYRHQAIFSLATGVKENSKMSYPEAYDISQEQLFLSSFNLVYQFQRELTDREISPSRGFSYEGHYADAQAQEVEDFSNTYLFNKLHLYFSGLKVNHSLALKLVDHLKSDDFSAYRFENKDAQVSSYTFARGYESEYAAHIRKSSLEYDFPLSYQHFGFKDYIHFNRITSKVFYDYSYAELEKQNKIMRSYGLEFGFESLTFRKLPINYRLRVMSLVDNKTSVGEFLLGINI